MTPKQQATRWFLRLRESDVTAAEQQRFEAWRQADAEHAAAYARVGRLWGAVDQVAATPELDQVRKDVAGYVNRRRWAIPAAAAAAVVAACVVGYTVMGQFAPPMQSVRAAISLLAGAAEGDFVTTIGQRSTVTLRDGSILTLNTDSFATVKYSDSERAITLARGQALFDVAKDEARPFVVYAGDQRIVATGTAFDVRVADAGVEVTLLEGRVHVDQTAAVPDAPRRNDLKAGERLIAKPGKPAAITVANVERVTSWTTGKLIFLDTRLAEAVAEANRYTQTPISLVDENLGEVRISGVFRAGQPAEFARALAQLYPIAVDAQADGRIRIKAKAN